MIKYLLVLLVLACGSATAGYQGKDVVELARTADAEGYGYHLYALGLGDHFTLAHPVCHQRNQMLVTLPNGTTANGCWWKIGEQVFGYSSETGLTQFTMDLLTVNDNFTGVMPRGF